MFIRSKEPLLGPEKQKEREPMILNYYYQGLSLRPAENYSTMAWQVFIRTRSLWTPRKDPVRYGDGPMETHLECMHNNAQYELSSKFFY